MLTLLTELPLLLTSALIGTLGNYVGFGGGVFMVPILVSFFHYPIQEAIGVTMISLIPAALINTIVNHRKKLISYKAGIFLEIPTILGTIFGAYLVSVIETIWLKWIFIVFLLLLSYSFFRKKATGDAKKRFDLLAFLNTLKPLIKIRREDSTHAISLWLLSFFGALSGTMAGLFGVGGGFLKTPIMVKIFKLPAKVATATALFMIILTSVSGSFSHFFWGHLDLHQGWPVFSGFVLGAFLNIKLSTYSSEKNLEKTIGVVLFVAAFIMGINLFT